MAHHVLRGAAVEVFLTGRRPHALPGPQRHGVPVASADQTDAVGAHQQLPVGVSVPIGPCPGVKRTSPTVSREVPSPPKTGVIHTSPVKFAAGVFTVAVVGFLCMSLL